MVEERRGTKQTSQVVHVLRLDPPVAFQGQTLEHVRLSLTVKVRRVPAKATVKANADYRELNVVERLVVHHIQMSSSCHIEHSRTENKNAMIKTAKSEPAKKKLFIMEGRKQSKDQKLTHNASNLHKTSIDERPTQTEGQNKIKQVVVLLAFIRK
ncbi:60S ribosomal protein L17 [Culex quinquefasciatus]|uniref:60S ribosomal protein L17 n=1 Tax=Culex quinquefasciatus TaxID=7176 RepID=B0XAE6_CULQU|nr:60S ribosomal protein L17 [Culex quinquefasciatus]|eukprot:XP_001866618.1 60S ribosomal protein L17 [Culex quinquefasciatus]